MTSYRPRVFRHIDFVAKSGKVNSVQFERKAISNGEVRVERTSFKEARSICALFYCISLIGLDEVKGVDGKIKQVSHK